MSRVNFQTVHEIVVLGDGGISYRKQCLIEDESVIVRFSDTKGAGWEYEAEGFILVYSTTSNRSFEIISHLHQKILQSQMVIVGSKCDLGSEHEVSINDTLDRNEEGQDLARALGGRFFEASAEAGMNVDEVFNTILREIWQLDRWADCKTEEAEGRHIM
ncbi:ras-domain-containing protein [Dendrothele bispora CBS 962.96]|uniref:Ras-domain-containing protein n=1 Tax=Dendrothele bispora (strain CBS 962.96) TaxID=1314807 RepID=A0A4S8LLU4_DENBC|nr:ras-domain-containing protein [Dendrothele bispora CBS 962.96]